MLYCERCNLATDGSCCPTCRNKRLRAVNDEDFCFFVNTSEFNFNMFENILKENNIEVVGVSYYTHGVTYSTAGRADGRKVYVRYKDFKQVKDIYEEIFGTKN